MQKIGVFVCWCGSNIAATVDIDKVIEEAQKMPGVVYAKDYQYMCSEVGQNLIKNAIKDQKLDRVVVASCSPRMHEATFRKAAKAAGLNPYLLEVANIREHCSWIHKEKEIGTPKAIALVRAAVAKATLNSGLTPGQIDVTKRALVIGGGIAGIQTALDIAEAGYQVDIIEKSPSIGGKMSQLDKTFPTLDCSACILTPKMVDAASHENITLYTYSELEAVKGYVGNFEATINQKARSVNMDKCTGCGVCTEKCPSKKAKSEFNEGLRNRGAIYMPFAQAVPNVPVIDREHCIKFKTGKCGVCEKVCTAGAIDFSQVDTKITKQYGAIVVSTGYDLISLDKFGEYQYGQHPDVITSLEFERLTNAAGPTAGHLLCPSDKRVPKKVVFIQCVGSRDKTLRGKPYCSKICCMYTAKHAMLLKDHYPDMEAYVFYIDVRTPGKNFEEFQRRAVEEYGVHYIKGMVGKVFPNGENLQVNAIDASTGETVQIDADIVVLAAATKAKDDATTIKRILGISTDTNNFFTEAHPKLRPVETHSAGIFLAGACQGPKDIPETVAQASAAAAKVIGVLSKDKLVNNPCVSEVDESICSGCLACTKICPYDAISSKTIEVKENGNIINKIVASVNEALCQGCGGCTVACRPGAIDLKGFTNKQILAEVDAICR
ncbi:CoB--CoM heterodisulfide reductase iron-sulfur subunit A family protein [Clostridium estertheticum]|uniref:CoB--CoM heterodisulfide reductase iron-sulfur subunit A family protein n=1 Tax=Clostridium estertheticum TaxID=238834 RepID=UPI001CF302D0|nr:CoB--CoM heterodisulfide reductase iron-sulfur subunit A family protein [Clostridium estertheticum]MCB2308274.1 CoB--CoM heterodisulfide reductase iron-sulfur subunit A family protein [Clostridium estertheticum]MCB2346398.1 CoB--CoM heterodisulfide reductase iron-sulfur subunit A family protein [Clostridium estertheticum]MCB2350831.1 CoB--CoM heterodisulfide reductase iron-sulfur subunit A family protein [Clostridium estertheticum]WAG44830.1 CoB--CoM heterodisulfide reductase iron-sulfur sub